MIAADKKKVDNKRYNYVINKILKSKTWSNIFFLNFYLKTKTINKVCILIDL